MVMKNSEQDFSNLELLTDSNLADLSMDSFFDGLLNDAHACTHTHTCNPPGPDFSHTHTCFHVHTKIVPSSSDDKGQTDDTAESTEKKARKRPVGNREAVRKYREKKKARTASLEDEVVRLRAMNQQLLKRLQGQAVLEAEIARLKCLLVDVRGRIEGEIGCFPYQKPANNPNLANAHLLNSCNLQCDDLIGCEFENLECMENPSSGLHEAAGCGDENGVAVVDASNGRKRKGVRARTAA